MARTLTRPNSSHASTTTPRSWPKPSTCLHLRWPAPPRPTAQGSWPPATHPPSPRTAHSIKGMVSNFCATRAYAAAQRVEQFGKSGNLAAAPAAAQTLHEDLDSPHPGTPRVRQGQGLMRILIAEDERLTRLSLARQLEAWGHTVTAVEDGQAACGRFSAPTSSTSSSPTGKCPASRASDSSRASARPPPRTTCTSSSSPAETRQVRPCQRH